MIAVAGLDFEEANHEYTWEGRKIPSVTTILKSAGIIETQWYTEEARTRGTHVHQAAHFFDEDDLAMESLRPEIRPFIDAYAKFRNDTGFFPVLVEQRIVHTAGYAGTLDRVGWLNDRMIQLDIKTGSVPDWAGLQTAAYEMGIEQMIALGLIELEAMPEARFALQLTAEGKYKLWPMTGHRDREFFLAALTVHQFKAGQ
jgi:hypothetical protein